MPIILMLLALVFRGVAFEYRWSTQRWKPVWNRAFFLGSLVASLMQASRLARWCRAYTSKAAPMPAAGGTG
jgi:cytochrome d ubiquinol oxidase subunit II